MIATKNNSAQQIAERAIVITRFFNAPRSRVFKAWTEPKIVMRWWSPTDFTSPFCTIDLRVGGVFHHCLCSSKGKYYWSKHVYRQIREPESLVCTDTFCDENGNIVSPKQYGLNDWPNETLIAVTFDDYDGKTKLNLQHFPVPQSRESDMCRQGWNECFDKLVDYLAKGSYETNDTDQNESRSY